MVLYAYMNIHPKTQEQLYAQTAALVDAQPVAHKYQLGQRLGEVASALAAGEDVVSTHERWNGETEEHILTPQDSVDFLRRAGPETRADIAFLSEKMQHYAEFRDTVTTALEGASAQGSHYLGRGSNGMAFRVEQDNMSFAAKTGGVSYHNVRAFRLGQDIEGISHLEAIDLDRGVSVMNLVPGRLAETMSFEERRAIPSDHILGVIDKVIQMHQAGLVIDPKPSNFLYDREQGFGIIDYHAADDDSVREQSAATQVLSLRTMLTYHPSRPENPKYGTPEYEAWSLQRTGESVQLTDAFLDVLEEDYPEVLQEAATEQAQLNDDPRVYSTGIYDVYSLPQGKVFDDFRARVERLGLQGRQPIAA